MFQTEIRVVADGLGSRGLVISIECTLDAPMSAVLLGLFPDTLLYYFEIIGTSILSFPDNCVYIIQTLLILGICDI